ncbi:MAG: alpha/beta fold hydrolase [Nanoarchaeota archaeon]|nr:alpha/beta fold hydrolase [Nanoarchaeota archaeon]
MPIKDITFQNSAGQTLSGVLRQSEQIEETKIPAILVLHGFNENMDREWIANLANYFSPYGFVTLRFDFHGHGASEGEFEEHTITQQIDDVMSAVTFLEQVPQVDVSKIAVIGHDIGGDIAILAAEKDARIKGLVVWGARGNLVRHMEAKFAPYELKELRTKGSYSHGQFDINQTYLESMKQHDVEDALKNLFIPILIIHGNTDLQVKTEEARTLFANANEPKQLELVDDADHWFRQPEAREYMFETILAWLNRWAR